MRGLVTTLYVYVGMSISSNTKTTNFYLRHSINSKCFFYVYYFKFFRARQPSIMLGR